MPIAHPEHHVIGSDRLDDAEHRPTVSAPERGTFVPIFCIDEPVPQRTAAPPEGASRRLFGLRDSFPLATQAAGDVDEVRVSERVHHKQSVET